MPTPNSADFIKQAKHDVECFTQTAGYRRFMQILEGQQMEAIGILGKPARLVSDRDYAEAGGQYKAIADAQGVFQQIIKEGQKETENE